MLPLLDLNTLHMVELAAALLSCVIWASTGFRGRSVPLARYLLAASLLLSFGAAVSVFQSSYGGGWMSVVAEASVLLGLSLILIGIRAFFALPTDRRLLLVLMAFALAVLAFYRERWLLREAIYLEALALIMLALLAVLLPRRALGPGTGLAGASAIVFVIAALFGAATSAMLGLSAHPSPALMPMHLYARLLMFSASLLLLFGIAVMMIEGRLADAEAEARQDDLTGISNRRHFMHQLQATHALASAEQGVYSIMIIDIDRFKRWNDGYGHATGDSALKHFTSIAVGELEPSDLLARTGGDEFCLLMRDRNEASAIGLAKRLSEALRGEVFRIGEREIALTVSIGIACYTPGMEDDENAILVNADIALYAAKNAGRDRYEVFDAQTMAGGGGTSHKPRFRASDRPLALPAVSPEGLAEHHP